MSTPIVLDEVQRQAVHLIETAPIGVITGGAGVGKTTVLKEAVPHLHSYELCAPTGKAAQRMTEATGRPARTIHRLLGWTPQGFRHGSGLQQVPLDTDVVVVDEASMVDVRLGADLMSALDRHTRVIFVGDANQLPPVGPGALFRDLIASERVPVVRLSRLYRASEGSWVYRNAPKVLVGGQLETRDGADFSWYRIGSGDAEHVGDVVLQIIREQVAAGTALEQIQVITPMNVSVCGTGVINPQLQVALNARGVRGTGWKMRDDCTLFEGDRVMQTKNDYQLDVFNGDVGVVDEVTPHELVVRFGLERRTYTRAQARNLMLAYAATVHKSQGAEFENVIVVCHSAHRRMLTRQLFYTAITRAKKRVFLVGDTDGLQIALATTRAEARKTRLMQRIQDGYA
jgi:exodeoxyribonuclease V alpha subunit